MKRKKTPKLISDFLEKMDWEGGLSEMVRYGIDVEAITKVDRALGNALSNYITALAEVENELEKYDGA
jgi:hypothetical protein